jgi:hypothetical protein
MRTISKEITKMQAVPCKFFATYEEIVSIKENKQLKYVEVGTMYRDSNGDALKDETTGITGVHYDLLMQANPSYAPNKPQNEYRESDLWHIIDLIRNGL